MPCKFLLFLFLQILLASCAVRQEGDPLVLAWERLCAGGEAASREDIAEFRMTAQSLLESEEFRLREMDSAELRSVLSQLAEAEGPPDIQRLMPRYVRIQSELDDGSLRTVSLILLLLSFFLLGSAVLFVLHIRQTRQLDALRTKAQVERAVSSATIAMQEEERGRIYAELHDTIAQDSRAVLFSLRELRAVLAAGGEGDVDFLLDNAEAMTENNIRNVRRVIRNIIPPDVMRGFEATVREWVGVFSAQSGISCSLCIREGVPLESLSQAQRLQLFRIMQEALANVQHHAHTDECTVQLRRGSLNGKESIAMSVSDDGAGFDLEKAERSDGHFGLRGMRNRVALLGGTFKITTYPDGGTHVFAEIPLWLDVGGGI